MERNGCFVSSCHGNQVFNDLKLTPPLPSLPIPKSMLPDQKTAVQRGFSKQMVLANRKAMLGNVSRFANLGGDLTQSRLITKNLPISEGGIHQRGGNNQFFEGDGLRDGDNLDIKMIFEPYQTSNEVATLFLHHMDLVMIPEPEEEEEVEEP